MAGGSGKLNEDDARLWSLIAAQVEPLKSTEARMREAARRTALAAAEPEPAPKAKAKQKSKPTRKPRSTASPAIPATATPVAAKLIQQSREDSRGRVAGVDRRTAERLRKGQYPIEARLDLHGLTQAQAHNALRLFVRQCHAAQKRCLLVITGKGGRQRARDDGPYVNAEPAGVLKRAVPGWLKDRDLSPLILSTATATPEHGGGGALYILLKRQR